MGEYRADPDAVEATLMTSRALLGVVARSIADVLHDVTLPQFRVLVVLSTVGRLRIGALADRMNSNPSTFSRTIDRMVSHGWVDRTNSTDSRREVLIEVTAKGRALVEHVTDLRRREIAEILGRLSPDEQRGISQALGVFARAAGEAPSRDLLTLGL
ncbi:MarR family transcriptional regulator [Amnibacterium flavum]|uniref:MarR family transcriptional regulator n=1 Tax=Amnibacterium flavum TaxID=2173173 RepID=A0A2V1HTM7_9MICO|nr:MarR family transcriptional regulator [Amnibacterium flavum]PVZ93667.1 MarR family transcriptional regulator [Amnibacterium flavum]